MRWTIYPWYTTGGEIGGIIVFTGEITERMRLEPTPAHDMLLGCN